MKTIKHDRIHFPESDIKFIKAKDLYDFLKVDGFHFRLWKYLFLFEDKKQTTLDETFIYQSFYSEVLKNTFTKKPILENPTIPCDFKEFENKLLINERGNVVLVWPINLDEVRTDEELGFHWLAEKDFYKYLYFDPNGDFITPPMIEVQIQALMKNLMAKQLRVIFVFYGYDEFLKQKITFEINKNLFIKDFNYDETFEILSKKIVNWTNQYIITKTSPPMSKSDFYLLQESYKRTL